MSERARLLGRRLPGAVFALRVDHTAAADAAAAALESTHHALRLAQARGTALDELTARVTAADAAYAPFCLRLLVRAIPADEFEQLELDHPPTPEQAERGLPWDVATYVPALLAACVDGDMTEQDWRELRRAGGIAAGESSALFALCLQVNDRSPDAHLGKD